MNIEILKLEKKKMIQATITDGKDSTTYVSGDNIDEVLAKIKSYHTLTQFERARFTKTGTLGEELKTGWYVRDIAE